MSIKSWFSGLFASSDGDRSPSGNFWFNPVGAMSASGSRVSAESAMCLSAVFRAVNLISGHIAMLPLDLRKEGTRVRVKSHPLYRLFKRPNAWQNGLEWRQMLTGHLLLRGNAYCEIISNARGDITALIPMHPDRCAIEQLDSGDWRYKITDRNGNQRTLARGQVWHLRGMSSNGITGVSVIECARESIGLGMSAQSYGARYFANDAKPTGGWIGFPGKFADPEAKRKFRAQVQEQQGGTNHGKTMVLDMGMQYHEIGINNKDSQFLESRQFQISDIARWFGVPPHKLADLSRATFSNIEQQALEYINDGLLYWAAIWEAAIECDLLFEDEGIEPEFKFAKLLRGDSGTRYRNYAIGITSGWLTRNEARDDDGREPLDGLDEPLRPLNMVEESGAEDLEMDTEMAEPTDQEAKEPADDGKDARMAAMIRSNAERLARRIVKAGIAEPALVAEALSVPIADAEAWTKRLWTCETFTVENVAASLMELAK